MSGNEFQFEQAPTPDEAAAAIAAIEQFLAETAVAPPPAAEGINAWLRSALYEGVGSSDERAIW